MVRADRLYLDTNILIALAEGADDLSRMLWEMVGSQKPDQFFLCTSELTLAELMVMPVRQKDDKLLRLYDNWLVSGGLFEVAPIDKPILWGAATIRARYSTIKLPDAIHLSTALKMGCGHVLSADRGIPDELEVWSQQGGEEVGPARLTTLRPDLSTLDAIIRMRAET